MPLIIKGGNTPTIISKKEMSNKLGQMKDDIIKNDPLSSLSPELAAKRREIIDAKRHREFMGKVALAEEDAMRKLRDAEVEVTSELLVDMVTATVEEHVDVIKVSKTSDAQPETPDFDNMTKKEIDEWAESALGLTLDRRKKKSDMVEIIKKNL